MVYTEIKKRNKNSYFYRVISIRDKTKIMKKRTYLGKNLQKNELVKKEKEADTNLIRIKKQNALEKIKPDIISILKKYKIKKAGIFGSYARGEQRKNSDVDILIQPPKGMGLEFVSVNLELEEKLGKKVHLVSYKFIDPYIKENILKEEIKII